MVSLLEASLPERLQWARQQADRFSDAYADVYSQLDVGALAWRDILNELAGRPDPSVTVDLSGDLPRRIAGLGPPAAAAALDAIISAREALEVNADRRLALESLMLALPALKGEGTELAPRGRRV
ncbi:MAG: hypothetical protein GEU28_12835 [Dehalococcoidia bacterium]|nr:hypothetical protein [Dehalococcoidia bacterium]